MSFRPIDTSWIERMNARRLSRPEVRARCRGCGGLITVREGFDPICSDCEEPSPSAKVLQHLAVVDRRPIVMGAAEVPARYRAPFVDLALWPQDPMRPRDLREWPTLGPTGEVEGGEPWALTIRGDFETGKTRLAVELAVCMAIRRKKEMLFIAAAGVAEAVFDSDPGRYQRLLNVPILVVDDLGRGYSGNQAQAVQRLICDRYNWLRTTILTTNCEEEAFEDPSVAVRLGEGLQIEMTPENRGRR